MSEVTVCTCPAQYELFGVECTCSLTIPRSLDEVDARMDVEALQAAGVCTDCGCIEEECECEWRF